MLNIIKSKLNIISKKNKTNNENLTFYYKIFIPAIRNWKSSIYIYNKNALKLIPLANKYVIKLIKSYFDSYNLKLEKKLRKERLRRRYRKLSIDKIFMSSGEFKHTFDKVAITLYIYNRQKYNYLYKLNKRYIRLFTNKRFVKKLNLIRNLGLNITFFK